MFAAASAKQPAALLAKGVIGAPVKFATNRLVLVVPKGNPAHITTVSDITKPGVKLVICAALRAMRRLCAQCVHEPRDHERGHAECRQ